MSVKLWLTEDLARDETGQRLYSQKTAALDGPPRVNGKARRWTDAGVNRPSRSELKGAAEAQFSPARTGAIFF
jgi:hypothetical protein